MGSSEEEIGAKATAGLSAFPVQILYRADSFPELEARTGCPLSRTIAGGRRSSLRTEIKSSSRPDFQTGKDVIVINYQRNIAMLIRIAVLGAIVVLGLCISPGIAVTISRGVDVDVTISAIWSIFAPLGTVRNWFPPFGI